MHESLDGLLSSAEAGILEAHVDTCAACRNEYARLSEVVSSLRTLPRSAAVPGDVWDGIAHRIGSATREAPSRVATVVSLPTAAAGVEVGGRRGWASRRRLTLSLTQLAAAAVVVALLSAGTAWIALGGDRAGAGSASGTTEAPAGHAARSVSIESGGYHEVLAELEQIVASGRSVLAPETLVTIEGSLRTVDAAIADVEQALADDPNSDLLLRMLATHRRTKLGVLQRAAAAVQAQT
jgi:anti-sigma factor RsiW